MLSRYKVQIFKWSEIVGSINQIIIYLSTFLIAMVISGCSKTASVPVSLIEEIPDSQTDNYSMQTYSVIESEIPDGIAAKDLEDITQLAVLVTSDSPLVGRIVEDQLSVELRAKGFEVISASAVYEITYKETLRSAIMQSKVDPNYSTAQNIGNPDLFVVARQLNLDAVIMSEVNATTRLIQYSTENTPSALQELILSRITVRLVESETGKTLLKITQRFDQGVSISALANSIADEITKRFSVR